jgi:hypothetical protein
VEFLSAEKDWLTDERDEIATEIQEGWDEAQRGELTDAEDVRAEMRQFKEDWMKQRRSA